MRVALPTMIEAANASPPVEIVVINYNSEDDLDDYIKSVTGLIEPNTLVYQKHTQRKYFHMAHSKNLAALTSSGEYIVTMGADILLDPQFIAFIRAAILKNRPVWLCAHKSFGGVVVCQRQEFIDAGGYDERFEFYGPEDRDFVARLQRRGGKYESIPLWMLSEIYTPNNLKTRDYDQSTFRDSKIWIKRAMSRAMHLIYEENRANNVLTANAGKEWGQ